MRTPDVTITYVADRPFLDPDDPYAALLNTFEEYLTFSDLHCIASLIEQGEVAILVDFYGAAHVVPNPDTPHVESFIDAVFASLND